MLSRQWDLDASEEFLLSGWTENYPLLHDLYLKKEQFYTILDSNHSRKAAEIAYDNWKSSLPTDISPFFFRPHPGGG
jgi:hypothetical protein